MPSIECAICSEEFGKRTDSSDVVVTPCGHVFHEMCLSKWLHHSVPSPEPRSCPECRQSVTMSQTRRIYFNLSSVIDNVQNYVEYLDTVITTKNNKLHMATMQLEKIKYEWMTKLREKDYEIQRLTEKLKHREQDYEVQKLIAKIEKLKSKLRESKLKHTAYPKVTMGAVQLSMSENMAMPVYQHPAESATHLSSMRMQQSCDASASIFSPNLSNGQTTGPTTTIQNPFDCEINAINSSIRSIRNPLSTFAPGYQSQNGYMSTNHIGPTFGAMMNPIPAAHSTQTSQQQNITYNQTSYFLPIQATNTINTAYFTTNEQNHFMGH